MSQRRSGYASGGNEGSSPSDTADRSDLVDMRAMAARTRSGDSGAGVPRANAAEPSSGNFVGARVTPSGGIAAGIAEMPNWLWTVFGCLSVLVVGFTVLWLTGLGSSGSAAVVATPAPAARAHVALAVPTAEPIPPAQTGQTGNIQFQQLAAPEPVMLPVRLPRAESRRFRYRRRLAAANAAAAAAILRAEDASALAESTSARPGAEKAAPAADPAPKESAGAAAAPAAPEAEAPAREAPPPVREKRTAAEVAVLGEAEDEARAREPAPREIVEATLKALTPRVKRCFFKFQIPGNVQVKVVATPQGGEAETVTVAGEFEGTPTGECVAAAVAGAPLPAFKGEAPLRLMHTYVLR